MPDNTKLLAILFIDICGSVKLFDDVGDERALAMTSACLDGMVACIRTAGGTVLEIRGDGILATFPVADSAFESARSAIESVQSSPLSVHAGLHFGPVIQRTGCIFGDAVNVAARLVDLAKENEIILSGACFRQLSKNNIQQIRNLGKIALKGKEQPMGIYLSNPQALDQTYVRPSAKSTKPPPLTLELIYAENKHRLQALAPAFVLGRHHDCDLIVQHGYVSRRHATIECKGATFFFLDHSTNGSFVRDESQQLTFLRRDMMQLRGGGVISLGIEPRHNPRHVIAFACSDMVR